MLTPKKEKFALEYLKDLNATQAAIRAGYSKKTAHSQGPRLLEDVEVKGLIDKHRTHFATETGVTVERVLAEYAKLGFSDIRKIFDDAGGLKPVTELDDDIAAAVTSVDVSTTKIGDETIRTHKIRLSDKKLALDSIARHLGMFKDSVELKSDALTSLLEKVDGLTSKVGANQL